MTAKTMAAILSEHRLDVTMWLGTGQEHLCICGHRSDDHDAHQAGELAAEGYGDVREAGARALEDAAKDAEYELDLVDEAKENAPSSWLRARAAAVRGEG